MIPSALEPNEVVLKTPGEFGIILGFAPPPDF
jgi:hypothetical protein